MYVDIVISNIFHLNKHFFFFLSFSFSLWCSTVPYLPARVTCGALAAHRSTYSLPSCRTTQYRRPLFQYQCPCLTILLTLYSMVWTGWFQEQGQCFFIGLNCSIPFCLQLFFNFSSFCLQVGIVGLGSLDRQGIGHSLPALHCRSLLIIIIIIISSDYLFFCKLFWLQQLNNCLLFVVSLFSILFHPTTNVIQLIPSHYQCNIAYSIPLPM